MIEFDIKNYQAADSLYLWWLANPKAPSLIGELRIVRSLKGVSLTYAPAWLKSGFALSEDLPLVAGELSPKEKETAVGVVDDARPDRWGERLIRFLDWITHCPSVSSSASTKARPKSRFARCARSSPDGSNILRTPT